MEIWLCAVAGILILVIIALLAKIYLLQKAAREIEEGFANRLTTGTNTLIDISSGDRSMRRLASAVNTQLRRLRAERRRFLQGDTELKNAVTNISHDLRTPLTAICGYLDLLEQDDLSEDAFRYTAIIRNRTELLKQLTEELFRYSVLLTANEEAAREPVVLSEVLEESIAAFYASLKERGITPEIKLTGNKITRNLNRPALSRIFSNLINNVLKYSDGDFFVSLSDYGEITFANTASALDDIQVGRLFDRFYTVEAARKSTGLGLAIARTFVEQMGGTITAGYAGNILKLYLRLCLKHLRLKYIIADQHLSFGGQVYKLTAIAIQPFPAHRALLLYTCSNMYRCFYAGNDGRYHRTRLEFLLRDKLKASGPDIFNLNILCLSIQQKGAPESHIYTEILPLFRNILCNCTSRVLPFGILLIMAVTDFL